MKHVWSVISQRSIVDQETNNISLVDIVEEINIPVDKEKFDKEKGVLLGGIIISTLIAKDKDKESESGVLLIRLFDPSGKRHKKEISQEIKLKKEHKRTRLRVAINKISFKEEGRYFFVISLKNNKSKKYSKSAELPIDVKFL